MANKRMFNIKICDSDAFLDMPLSTQALYFHLNMKADDDGFVGNPKRIQRTIGASEDDLKLLKVKRFLLEFEDGVIVIKHWRMHNCIQKDRYTPTVYQDELEMLYEKKNKSYTLDASKAKIPQKCIQNGNEMYTEMETDCIQNVSADIDIDIDKDINIIDICSEPSQASEPQSSTDTPVITIILNTKEEYPIYQTDINEWQELYPAVDVMQQLRNMKGWCNANPSKRKTKKGIKRFINGWLSKEQDKGGRTVQPPQNTYTSQKRNNFNNIERRNYDMNSLEKQLLGL